MCLYRPNIALLIESSRLDGTFFCTNNRKIIEVTDRLGFIGKLIHKFSTLKLSKMEVDFFGGDAAVVRCFLVEVIDCVSGMFSRTLITIDSKKVISGAYFYMETIFD